MFIEVTNATKVYAGQPEARRHLFGKAGKARDFTVFTDINLSIREGEFVCLLGLSGCGKSTLLNAMAGFLPLTEGSIEIDGVPVVRPSEKYVTIFQDYGLYPWRTVEKNIALGLENKHPRIPTAERRERVCHYIDTVGLRGVERRFPHQLSGGMQQRVSIARALAVRPKILFMDEPFGALDAITRIKMQDEIIRIWSEEKMTIVFVTHDIDEAVYLADRIVLMEAHPGRVNRIIDVDAERPRNRTSRDFFAVRDGVFHAFEEATNDHITT